MADKGATIILSSRNEKELNRVKNSLANPEKHIVYPLDMSKLDEINQKTGELCQKMEKENKKIDIVVENAGVSQRARFVDTDYDTHDYMTKLNYLGPVAHTKGYINHMIKNKAG